MNLSGFVLAGGRSSRMGRDKALLNWHGRTLLEHMISLVQLVADRVQVVGRDPVPDRLPGLGPLSGVATGLEATSTDGNLFVAVDLPCLTKEFLIYFGQRIEKSSQPLVDCKIGSAFPLCLGVCRPMLPEIKQRLAVGQLSLKAMIEAAPRELVSERELESLGFSPTIFQNINTDEQYRAALDQCKI
jgi:molybdopterin-guanine dinucleotide biosynthesis protein A